MSLRDALAAIARGERSERLLGACWLGWGEAEAFGEEAIRELFRAAPLDLADATLVGTATGAALAGTDAALVADVYDGRIGRLWRIGEGAFEPEPFVAVAADPDLRQERGGVLARREDHPELATPAFDALVGAGQAFAEGPGVYRTRAFLVRAFGDAERAAGLFAIHSLSGGPVRAAGFGHALVLIEAGGVRRLADPPRTRAWTPRL